MAGRGEAFDDFFEALAADRGALLHLRVLLDQIGGHGEQVGLGVAHEDVDRALRRQRLATLIGRLSPKCRAVLVMHYRDDLSYKEIGEQLSISPNMVKKYIVKGLAACRQGMARYE